MSTNANFSIGIQIQGIRAKGDQTSIYIAEALQQIANSVNTLSKSVSALGASAATGATAVLTQQLMGTLDGVNNVFTVTTTPSTIAIFRNGVYLDGQSATPDYTISGTTINFAAFSVPQPTDKLWALIWP